MRYERSYGAVPLRYVKENGWVALIIQHKNGGHWSFPKGHMHDDETPQEAARRELKEETSLEIIRFISDPPIEEEYRCRKNGEDIYKTVFYFLVEVKGDLILQEDEVMDAKWVSIEAMADEVTFPEIKKVCKSVENIMRFS